MFTYVCKHINAKVVIFCPFYNKLRNFFNIFRNYPPPDCKVLIINVLHFAFLGEYAGCFWSVVNYENWLRNLFAEKR